MAAIVAVAGHSAALDQGIRRESRSLLAADLVVAASRPLPDEVAGWLAERADVQVAAVRELATTVALPGNGDEPGASRLVELKAVEPGYPFYGRLALEPERPLGELLGRDGVVVAPDLLRRLDTGVGETLLVGGEPFRITGVVEAEPDRVADAFTLGPRIFLSRQGLERTRLEQFGSRIHYRTLIRLADASPAAIEALQGELEARLDPAVWQVETHRDAQPALRAGLARAARFLGLVALLSLLLGGLGVAETTRAWLAGRMDSIAVLRCLGARPREVLTLYLGQTAFLGLAGSAVGAVAGTGIQALVPRLAADLLPVAELQLWQPAALARGVAAGVGVALLCSLPSLLTVRRVPPLRVLRRDVEPLPPRRGVQVGLVVLLATGVGLLAAVQAESALWGTLFVAGLAVAAALLGLAGWALVRTAAPLRRLARGTLLRQALAGLARPGMGTLGAILALGLGILLVVGMALVERGLSGALLAELPRGAPSAFLVDIQSHQWPDVATLLERSGAESLQSVPVVTARLAAIGGVPVRELTGGEQRWALTREQRLTYLEELPTDNRVVAGSLWRDPDRAEVSVEEGFAEDLGIALGDVLTFDVQGVAVDLAVTSLRSVDWRSFRINFFLVVEPGVLDAAPQSLLATASLPPGAETEVQDLLAASVPNVTLIQIREVLETVAGVMRRVAFGVRFLGSFTAVTGVLILGGAVAAAAVRRGHEIALLKTLGMTRREVAGLFAAEYALVGLTAGLVGVAGGNLLAWAVLTRGMEVEWQFAPLVAAAAVVFVVVLAAVTGVTAGWRALAQRPLAVLQAE